MGFFGTGRFGMGYFGIGEGDSVPCDTIPIKGVAARVVAIDVTGAPITGLGQVVLSAYTQVQMTPQYEGGSDFTEVSADNYLISATDPPNFKRMNVQVDLITVDPDLVTYMIATRELVTTAPVGMGFAMSEGGISPRFSLEVWQRVAAQGACLQGQVQYVYNAWPNCYGTQINAYAISNARSTLSFVATTSAAGSKWLGGPGHTSWMPNASPVILPTEHWVWTVTPTAPPIAACGVAALV